MDLDVRVKATLLAAVFLIVSDIAIYLSQFVEIMSYTKYSIKYVLRSFRLYFRI